MHGRKPGPCPDRFFFLPTFQTDSTGAFPFTGDCAELSGNLKNQKILLMGYAGRPFAIPIGTPQEETVRFVHGLLRGEFVGNLNHIFSGA